MMSNSIKNFCFVIALIFSACPVAGSENEHQHGHGPKKHPPAPEAGKKFESDKPLRSHMSAIRTEMQSRIKSVHQGQAKEEVYRQLAERIDGSVRSIFKDCKLKPEADAALHVILTEIMAGSSSMKSGVDAKTRADGFSKVVNGLKMYAQTFHDSGWKPIEEEPQRK